MKLAMSGTSRSGNTFISLVSVFSIFFTLAVLIGGCSSSKKATSSTLDFAEFKCPDFVNVFPFNKNDYEECKSVKDASMKCGVDVELPKYTNAAQIGGIWYWKWGRIRTDGFRGVVVITYPGKFNVWIQKMPQGFKPDFRGDIELFKAANEEDRKAGSIPPDRNPYVTTVAGHEVYVSPLGYNHIDGKDVPIQPSVEWCDGDCYYLILCSNDAIGKVTHLDLLKVMESYYVKENL